MPHELSHLMPRSHAEMKRRVDAFRLKALATPDARHSVPQKLRTAVEGSTVTAAVINDNLNGGLELYCDSQFVHVTTLDDDFAAMIKSSAPWPLREMPGRYPCMTAGGLDNTADCRTQCCLPRCF